MGSEPERPQVFICHSSEDKERFVEDFAIALRQNGIDAWYDDWELKLGDSLTNRILGDLGEEGAISESDYFLVVVSKHSIESEWVQEELGRGLVDKVGGETQILPLIIDLKSHEVPSVLDNIYWHRVEDVDEPDEALEEVLAAIFNKSLKPALGEPPDYDQMSKRDVSASTNRTPQFNDLQKELMEQLYDGYMESCSAYYAMEPNGEELQDEVHRELKDLEVRGLIEYEAAFSGTGSARLTPRGRRVWEEFIHEEPPRFNSLQKEVLNQLYDGYMDSSTTYYGIESDVGETADDVRRELKDLADRNLIEYKGVMGGGVGIARLTSYGRRTWEQMRD